MRSPDLREGDQAEVTVTVMRPAGEKAVAPSDEFRRFAGAVNSGDANAGDNQRIDADLAAEYGGAPKSES